MLAAPGACLLDLWCLNQKNQKIMIFFFFFCNAPCYDVIYDATAADITCSRATFSSCSSSWKHASLQRLHFPPLLHSHPRSSCSNQSISSASSICELSNWQLALFDLSVSALLFVSTSFFSYRSRLCPQATVSNFTSLPPGSSQHFLLVRPVYLTSLSCSKKVDVKTEAPWQ